ncbi:porin [Vibrio mytili]|uniref:Membrane protein n=1 Tax=Vibrio mytili TaxID=50718 RepID=A0A0C3IC09_9VIBR|nr:porin [Vibrio mytili]KIN12525.1 membrane protein [Vibrio mytili]
MKQAALATAILSALVTAPSFAATVYDNDGTELKVGGRVEFRGDFIGSGGEEVEGTMKDKSRARVNLKGKTDIGNGLSAFGVYEAEQKTGESEFKNRYMYAGVGTEAGDFSVGRQDMAAVIISDMTDITEFSGVQQVIDSSSDKQDSVFAYRGEFDALKVQATYQANSDEDSDKYGLSGMYSLPMGLDLGLAYSGGDVDADNSEDQILGGIAYSMDNLYLAGTYSQGSLDDSEDFTAYEIAATYKVASKVTIAGMYTFQENDPDGASEYDAVDGFELAGYYKLNSNFRTYLSYYFNQLDEEKDQDGKVIEGEDTLRLGVRYDF